MEKARNTIVRILELLIGVVFLISFLGKIFEVDKFAELIVRYGFPSFSFLAPLIVVFEALCAFFLLLNVYPKVTTIIAALMLVCFTGAFFYANTYEGITDCGCFGNLVERTPVWITYVRNIILMVAAVLVLLWLPKEISEPTTIKWIIIAFSMLFVSYEAGHTYHRAPRYKEIHPLYRQPIKNTVLQSFVNTSKDSTYFIYVFSYDCTTCIDGLNNVKEFDDFDTCSRLIGLAVSDDRDSTIHHAFHLSFNEINVGLDLQGVITGIPVLLYIKHDTIQHVIEGSVPSLYSFKKYYIEN